MEHAQEPRMHPTSMAALARLLGKLFPSAARITAFVRSFRELEGVAIDLPGDTVSVGEMAHALAGRMLARNLVTREFFAELTRIRPFQWAEIYQTADAWGIHFAGGSKPIQPRARKALLTGGLCAAALYVVWLVQELKRPPNRIDMNESDPIILTVASRETGETWSVALSRHRTCESAARDLFFLTRLKGDSSLREEFMGEEYRLCQEEGCCADELVGEAIDDSEPVGVERRNQDFRTMLLRMLRPQASD